MSKIQAAVMGYGNLGRGVECALAQNDDMELAGIFTRRDPATIRPVFDSSRVFHADQAIAMKKGIDVMILCGGSATDLMTQSVQFAADFHVVDSFDTHARIPEHVAAVDAVARKNGTLAILSVGWDPGLFSLNRLFAQSVLPAGKDYTFWGKGVSQGHSDAIRRIDGVENAIQYTIPVDSAVEGARSGSWPDYRTREKHVRECFVVAGAGADQEKIRREIVGMPNYFADYDTTVHFLSREEFEQQHVGMPHGGFVIRSGKTGARQENSQAYEFSLQLDSNPEFTASVLVAYARAACRMAREGAAGAKTILEIPPHYTSPRELSALIKELL